MNTLIWKYLGCSANWYTGRLVEYGPHSSYIYSRRHLINFKHSSDFNSYFIQLVWSGTSNDHFSIKSVYHLRMQLFSCSRRNLLNNLNSNYYGRRFGLCLQLMQFEFFYGMLVLMLFLQNWMYVKETFLLNPYNYIPFVYKRMKLLDLFSSNVFQQKMCCNLDLRHSRKPLLLPLLLIRFLLKWWRGYHHRNWYCLL